MVVSAYAPYLLRFSPVEKQHRTDKIGDRGFVSNYTSHRPNLSIGLNGTEAYRIGQYQHAFVPKRIYLIHKLPRPLGQSSPILQVLMR